MLGHVLGPLPGPFRFARNWSLAERRFTAPVLRSTASSAHRSSIGDPHSGFGEPCLGVSKALKGDGRNIHIGHKSAGGGGVSRLFLALSKNSTGSPFHAAFLKATNSVNTH